ILCSRLLRSLSDHLLLLLTHFFFSNATPTTEIYTLSLHDALPISRWLREQLALTDLPAVTCAEYAAWYADIDPHSTVLVFPDAYLNSPSSMFGHTLLRIDSPDMQDNGTALLSYALNFGAMVEQMDNSMLYAWKGLAGGYPGQFSLLPYRDKISEYSSLENRDLWEYRLDLTPEETGRLV